MATTSGGSTGGGFANEASTVEEKPKRDAEVGAEECGEDGEQPLRRHGAGRRDTEGASEISDEWKKCQRADESPPLHEGRALGFERLAPFVFLVRAAFLRALGALLGALAPIAAPSTSCHERRLALGGTAVGWARGELFVGLRRLLLIDVA